MLPRSVFEDWGSGGQFFCSVRCHVQEIPIFFGASFAEQVPAAQASSGSVKHNQTQLWSSPHEIREYYFHAQSSFTEIVGRSFIAVRACGSASVHRLEVCWTWSRN